MKRIALAVWRAICCVLQVDLDAPSDDPDELSD
jgi:hypothetical protein